MAQPSPSPGNPASRATRRERWAARVGWTYIGGLLTAYAAYLLLAHTALGLAYASPWLWEPAAPLASYRDALDLRAQRFLFRPLLLGLPVALGLLAWAYRDGPTVRAVRDFWRTLPAPHRAVPVVLVGLVLLGQALDDKRALFPFARWSMYGRAYEPERITMYDLYGVTPSGEHVLINVARTFPPIHRGAPRKFSETARVWSPDEEAPPEALARAEEAALAIGRYYEDLHGLSFTALEVVEERVDVEGPGAYRRSRAVVRTLPLTD